MLGVRCVSLAVARATLEVLAAGTAPGTESRPDHVNERQTVSVPRTRSALKIVAKRPPKGIDVRRDAIRPALGLPIVTRSGSRDYAT